MRILAIAMVLWAMPAWAEQAGFVKLADGQSLYVRHEAAAPGEPTVVVLNGLTYTTAQWEPYVRALKRGRPGLGIVSYDMKGMGRTLLKGDLPVNYPIPFQGQAEQLGLLLDALRIPRAHLVGLSYGGAIAMEFASRFPARAESLILFAPFTEPLEKQDQFIRAQIRATRLTYPLNPATEDELYDFFLRAFIYSTYPASEPVVLENPFKLEAIYRMVQSIRLFQAKTLAHRLPAGSVHLIVAKQDQYIPREVMDRFWDALPAQARASRLNLGVVDHKVPESLPGYSAAWTLEILRNREIGRGRVFEGTNWNFKAVSGDLVISLPH